MRPPQETIRTKRDGGTLTIDEIDRFVAGLTDGRVTEGQAAAFAMAVFFRGMSREERVALTQAMMRSGSVLRWDLPGSVLDKHSTGGVGDTVSLALAPMVAACGGYVPMISGRGLGHTGGTLDKLASIPGYDVAPSLEHLRAVVRETGCAIIGQTDDLAPADRRLYAIRDVTGTVESIDLITASILSKKLAAGLDGLVMDVKAGSGAFMPTLDASHALAESIVEVAVEAGCPTVALLTDMDAPLASTAGNALEVRYALDYLTGHNREPRFHAVTRALAAEMLVIGGLSTDRHEADGRIEAVLASGAAAETFGRMVRALGGPGDLIEHAEQYLPESPIVQCVRAERTGYIASVETRDVGLAVLALGGGRTRPQDDIDPAVGLTRLARPGDRVGPDSPLAVVHARDTQSAEAAARTLREAYTIADAAPTLREVVLRRVP